MPSSNASAQPSPPEPIYLARLREELASRYGIIVNADDPCAGQFLRAAGNQVLTFGIDRKAANRLDLFAHYGLAAATEALRDSGLELTDETCERTGTIIGTAGCGRFVSNTESGRSASGANSAKAASGTWSARSFAPAVVRVPAVS